MSLNPQPGHVPFPADSIAADSAAIDTPAAFGIILTPPGPAPVPPAKDPATGMSVILSLIFLLFLVISLRFRNNERYITAILRSMTEVRDRQNAFDDTVRETSFLILTNILWIISAGIILRGALGISTQAPLLPSDRLQAICTVICIACAFAYATFLSISYIVTGTVFTDSHKARMWLKGFAGAQALAAVPYLPLSLVMLFHPQWSAPCLLIAAIIFILSKLLVIWKGFRIFFNRSSSWVLFLYYLCSLEIVPLILTYLAATSLCGSLQSL